MADIQRTIVLVERRCYDCGSFWAIEQMRQNMSTCPHCAEQRIARAVREQAATERSNRSLRGALKRAKRT